MSGFTLSNRTYNVLKDNVELLLPSLGVLYAAFAQIWGLPFAEQVVGSLAALAVFFGVLLRIARRNYVVPTDGNIVVEENANESGQVFASLADVSPDDLVSKGTVTLSVTKLGGS